MHMVFREIYGIEKNILRIMAILETSQYSISFLNKKILKSFANGKGNFPQGCMLDFLFFPNKLFIRLYFF